MSIIGSIIQSAGGGGALTVNDELLSSDKTIADGDPQIQILDPNTANRNVTLPATPTEGSLFQITNANGSTTTSYELSVFVGSDTLAFFVLGIGQTATFIYENSEWKKLGGGAFYRRTGVDAFERNEYIAFGNNSQIRGSGATTAISIGNDTNCYGGIAIGSNTNVSPQGVAIGTNCAAYSNSATAYGYNAGNAGYQQAGQSTAIGANANAVFASTALGDTADPMAQYQTVLGSFVDGTTRYAGFVKNVFATNANVVFNEELGWLRTTTDATITELFLAGVASNRAVIAASSLVSFRLNIVAREAATGDCKVWEVLGAIKRDGSNNTALVGSVTSTVVAADAGASAWAVTVDADDTNESLRIQVTGEASHTITWAAHATILDRR